jgi:ABC-type multidrug transport system ATPase subunit
VQSTHSNVFSGSGKSTLLHVLAQRSRSPITSAEGLLYLNGIPIDAKYLHRVSAYVQQEDALIGSLTVSETLDFAARLSTPSMSKTERLARIDTLLAAFGLSDLANDLIGTAIKKGISGGQKRRVSVAAQLVTGPRLLFLDEPTSGLDSAAAFEVMSYLKSVAQKYRVGCPISQDRTCADIVTADRHCLHSSACHVHLYDV